MLLSKKLFALLLLGLIAIAAVSHAHAGHSHDEDEDEDEEDGNSGEADVVVGTKKNFDALIADNEFVLVEFYAPWCGHCKSLAPEYAKAATQLKGSGIVLAKVDATEETELGEKFGVRGYPTLKFFTKGVASEYNGGRVAPEIVSWLKKKTGPPATPLNSADDLAKFQKDNEVAVVGFFTHDGDAKNAFLDVARGNDDIAFGIVTDAAVAAGAHGKTPEGVSLFKHFDEKRNDFSGSFTKDAIAQFVNAHSIPLVLQFNDETVKKIFGSKINNKALYFVDYDSADFKAQEADYRKAAEHFKGKAVFVTVNKDKEQVLEYFGLKAEELPVFFMLKMSEDNDMKKYKHDGPLSGLNDFISNYLEGKVKPHLKSEPVPEPNPNEHVRTLVGSNFAEVTFDESKDVLVEFYAPWCGHCKSLAPKYEKLAKKFAGVPSIVIAKVDATANDIEGVEISGFPTIKFWPAGKKEKAVDYDGARTVKGFVKFLKEHATHKFELPEKASSDNDKEDL